MNKSRYGLALIGLVIMIVVFVIGRFTGTGKDESRLPDSSGNPPPVETVKQTDKPAQQDEQYNAYLQEKSDKEVKAASRKAAQDQQAAELTQRYKDNWSLYITSTVISDHDGVFGGYSNIKVTVKNGLPYKAQEVEVNVVVLTANNDTFSNDFFTVENIPANGSKTFTVPTKNRGSTLNVTVHHAQIDALGINDVSPY